MELTLDQALQKGVEAHKAGKAQEADRYYTAILKANPKHPDANHNMGVLAVGVGKVEAALPFFKTALETNPNIAQYWLSYIDALIKLDQITDAKTVLDQAKSKGVQGEAFNKIEKNLGSGAKIKGNQTNKEILKKAVGLRENGKYDEAIDLLLYHTRQSPTDPNVTALLSHCYILNDNLEQAKIYLDAAKNINPNIASVGWNETRLLLKQKKVDEALVVAQRTNKLFPDDVEGISVLGSCFGASGNFDESRKYLNKAIEINPNDAGAILNRGLISLTQKDKVNALSDLEKAHQLKPHIKQIWDLIIALYFEENQYEKAINCLVNMIEIDPSHQKSLALLAQCNQKADDTSLAIMSFQRVLEVIQENAPMHVNLGIAMNKQGDHESAVEQFNKALSIKPNHAEAYNNMGVALKDQGKLEEAIKAYTKALSIKPDYDEAYLNMGNALKDQSKLEEAIQAYSKALSLRPDYAEAYLNIGNILENQYKLDEAIEAYNKALSIKPDYDEAYNNMGVALEDQGKPGKAIEAFNKALSIKPDYDEAYLNLGNALADQGNLDEAVEAYIKALSIRPNFAEAHRNLSMIKKYTEDDKHFLQVQKVSKRKDLSKNDKCQLGFALAKMYEDIGKVDQTFTQLSKSNALRRKLLKYSINQDAELFNKLKETQPDIQKISLEIKKDSIEPIPIFILGMPRSGTTLVEQIISSHSEVTGAGELSYVSQFGGNLVLNSQDLNQSTMSKFKEKYLLELSNVSNGQQLVTDKMPHNFLFIPLICAAFPEAKIVHVQRSAAATCWSNYKQYFQKDGFGYSYDIKDVVAYYHLYIDLMKFWQSNYDDKVYNLNYESLTTEQEQETRKLIKHLGLDWEDACIAPHQNKRSVRTASQRQVRQKVYKGSSEAWRKYEPFLNGAFDRLPS